MHDPLPFVEGASGNSLSTKLFQELMVHGRLGHFHVFLGWVGRVEVNVHVLGGEFTELGQILPAKHVATTLYLDLLTVLVVLKA